MEILGQRCACLVFAGLNVRISAVIHLQHSVHPGWNSLTACTQALLKRKGALQELWSARKFSFQADRVDGQAPELPRSERFHVTGNFIRDVSEAITSQWFWSYCRMINVFSSFLSHLASWCEGCLCHEEELLEGPSFYHRQRVTRHSNLTCDYKGRRAPELAAGVFDEKVRVMVATSLSEILATSHGLSEEQQGHILMDFHSAIDKTMLEVQVKTQHWQLLPWKLAISGHPDQEIARAGLRECVKMYKDSKHGAERHHVMTKRFLDPHYRGHCEDDYDVSLLPEVCGAI